MGLLFRWLVVLLSIGSNDVHYWHQFATSIGQVGLADTYRTITIFNHPPLMGLYSALALKVSVAAEIRFAILLKIPAILGEIITARLLYLIVLQSSKDPRTAALTFAGYAWSISAIAVSSYHGNTDCLCVALALGAAYFVEKERFLLGGLILAGAVNVKLIPVLLFVPYCTRAQSIRQALRFIAGFAVGLIPFVFVWLRCFPEFYRNAIAYQPNRDNWGLILFISEGMGSANLKPYVAEFARFFFPWARYAILISVTLFAIAARPRQSANAYQLGCVGFVLFLVLASGFGIQYVAYVGPFLFAVSYRRGMIYAFLSGLFVFSIYFHFWNRAFPYESVFVYKFPMFAGLVGILPWAYLVALIPEHLKLLRRPTAT